MTVFRNLILLFLYFVRHSYNKILNSLMWIILTAFLTLLVLLALHSFYDYLKRTLTVPKVHDLQTMETLKRKEIESILEEV